MDNDDTSTPMGRPSSHSTVPGWRAVLRRLAIAGVFFVGAIVTLAGLASHLSPELYSRALTTFFGWPLPTQALVILGLATGTGALAAGKQIYQTIQNREAQNMIERAMKAVLDVTIVPLLAVVNRELKRLAELIEISNLPPVSPEPAPAPIPPDDQPVEQPSQPVEAVYPPQTDIFVGREVELDWLVQQIEAHSHDHDVTVIHGIPGIGKSVLVTKARDQFERGRFTGAVHHIVCAELSDHIDIIRTTLEFVEPNRHCPPTRDLDILRETSEQLLTDRERLIILDGVGPNVRLSAVVHALRTHQRMAHILITTTKPPAVEVAPIEHQLHLGSIGMVRTDEGTEVDGALEAFARYAGLRTAADFGERKVDAAKIVEALDRHTYALQLMGGYVRLQLSILHGIANDVSKLREGMVNAGLEDVLRPVWLTFETVEKDFKPEAQTLLCGFVAAFERVEAGRLATRAIADGLGLRNKDGAILDLLNHELMVSDDDSSMPKGSDWHRLKIHPLLLGHITQRLERPEWHQTVTLARDASARFYADYISRFDHHDPSRSAQSVLERDADNITRSLEWAIEHEQHEQVVALAQGMRRLWHDRWRNDLTEKFMPRAVESATALAERARERKNTSEEIAQRGNAANFSFTLGRMYRRTGRLNEAEPLFQRDLAFHRQQHQYAEQAEALHQLAQLERSRGRMKLGLRYCRKGLTVVRRHLPHDERDDTSGAKKVLLAKGLLIAQKGRIQRSRGYLTEADKLFQEAFTLFTRAEDVLEQGVALGYRGRIARVRGQIEQALKYFKESDELAQQVHDYRGQGVIATQLGRIDRMHGDMKAAKKAFEKGLSNARLTFDRQAEVVNLNYLGRIANSAGDRDTAEKLFRKSLELARKIDDRLDEGVNLGHLGRIAHKKGHYSQARWYFAKSLAILREVEDRRGQGLFLAHMALVDVDEHHFIRARWRLRRGMRLIRQVGDKRSEGTLRLFQGRLEYASRRVTAAQMRFTAAFERAHELGDTSGEEEALEWLDKLGIPRGPAT